MAGGEGSFGIGSTSAALGLDGATVGCQSLPDLPRDRKGAVGAADSNGNVLVCGGLTVNLKKKLPTAENFNVQQILQLSYVSVRLDAKHVVPAALTPCTVV